MILFSYEQTFPNLSQEEDAMTFIQGSIVVSGAGFALWAICSWAMRLIKALRLENMEGFIGSGHAINFGANDARNTAGGAHALLRAWLEHIPLKRSRSRIKLAWRVAKCLRFGGEIMAIVGAFFAIGSNFDGFLQLIAGMLTLLIWSIVGGQMRQPQFLDEFEVAQQ